MEVTNCKRRPTRMEKEKVGENGRDKGQRAKGRRVHHVSRGAQKMQKPWYSLQRITCIQILYNIFLFVCAYIRKHKRPKEGNEKERDDPVVGVRHTRPLRGGRRGGHVAGFFVHWRRTPILMYKTKKGEIRQRIQKNDGYVNTFCLAEERTYVSVGIL